MIETIRAESAEVDVDVLGPTSTAVNLSEWKSDHHLSSQPLVVIIILAVKPDQKH